MNARLLWLSTLALLLQVTFTIAKRDKALYCSVCRAVVVEVNDRIGDVDPNKKVNVGGFRVDTNGNQKLIEKQYARSDVHIMEIFEDVCDTMMDYALTQAQDGKLGIVRTKTRSGEELDTSNVGFNKNLGQTFKSYCESMIEDFEDEMLGLFKLDNLQSMESELCGEVAKACTEEDLNRPLTKLNVKTKREFKTNSFHQLEPEEEEEEELDADEDLENNIIEPASPTSKKKNKNEKEEL